MILVPIPLDKLEETRPAWLPLLQQVAQRLQCTLEQRLGDVYSGSVQLTLVVDPGAGKVSALVGTQITTRGNLPFGRIVWLTGSDRKKWISLYPQLEELFRSRGCVGMEAFARTGWSRTLKDLGYRQTHVVFEKEF